MRDASRSSKTPEQQNIQTIIGLERENRGSRSPLERVADAITAVASSPAFLFGHLVWFGLWIGLNSTVSSPIDPYPFRLLTLVVSLEAIVLTGFVLMAQSRMTQLADRRAHLDLQINVLAEQELTAILKVVCLVGEKLGLDVAGADPRVSQLLTQTDVRTLAATLNDELQSMDSASAAKRTT